MWGKQNDGQTPQMPQTSPQQFNAAPAPAPAASMPNKPAAPGKPNAPTVFGKSMKIIGEVTSDEELYIDGELEGKLNLRERLTIGPSSKVSANIKAREVVVFGTVRGNVEAEDRISLRAGATIVGDIKTAGIIIEDGAYFKGGIDISRVDAPRAEAPRVEAPKAPVRAAGAAAGEKR
jgi:cytoskeletal protein CcmA (bactofilin family)